MFKSLSRVALFLFAATVCSLSARAQNVNSPADFTIHAGLTAINPPRAGFNFSDGDTGLNVTSNAWIADSGSGRVDARVLLSAEGGDGSSFYTTDQLDDKKNQHSGGTDMYETVGTGYYNGTLARVYRFTANKWALLRTGTVTSYVAIPNSNKPEDHTVMFDKSGPPIQKGDIIWLSRDGQLNLDWSTIAARVRPNATASWFNGGIVADAPPGDNGGSPGDNLPSSVLVSTDKPEVKWTGNYFQGLFPGTVQFEAGHTYGVSVWLKQKGVADGSATFHITEVNEHKGVLHTFTGVTGAWKQFTWQFPAPTNLQPGWVGSQYHMEFQGPGSLWINRFKIFDASHPPDTLDPRARATFQEFHPGTIRIWSNFANASRGYSYWSLSSWLAPEDKNRLSAGNGTNGGTRQHLPAALALCKQLGANPWLLTNISLSEQEWSDLIDYLASPAGSTPFAKKRPADHLGPYTADFDTIYLEFGNEEWGTHQTDLTPTYGQWAHYLLGKAKANPHFDAKKIKLVLNGFTYGIDFGSNAAANAPEGDLVDFFSYSQGDGSGDDFYQNELLAVPHLYQGKIDEEVARRDADAAKGHPYGLAVYEGGPGADDPNANKGQGDVSLAAAVAALDVHLYGAQKGFGPQNFFLFNPGIGQWSSHTNYFDGFRPYPIWEALSMRNNYCAGSLVAVDTNAAPLSKDGAPLIGTYVFRKNGVNGVPNTSDVVVLSRDLKNTTPVTLHFPTDVNPKATLYTLTGDPRASNDKAMTIPIVSKSVSDFGRDYSFSMPPGSIYIFRTSTGAWPQSAPKELTAKAAGVISLAWKALPSARSYNIYRSDKPGAQGETPLRAGVAGTSFVDLDARLGGTYYYKVAGVLPSGALSDFSTQASGTAGLGDVSFEQNVVPGGTFLTFNEPTGSAWVFKGAGVVRNKSWLTNDGTDFSAYGDQIAYLQSKGSFAQTVSLGAGTYTLSFWSAQRGGKTGEQDFQVIVDGKPVGPIFKPAGTHYEKLSTPPFTIAAGQHTSGFQSLDTLGGDRTAFVDNVRLSSK